MHEMYVLKTIHMPDTKQSNETIRTCNKTHPKTLIKELLTRRSLAFKGRLTTIAQSTGIYQRVSQDTHIVETWSRLA